MKVNLLLLIAIIIMTVNSNAQVITSGDITVHIDSIINEIPGATPEGLYLQPGASSRALWRGVIQGILSGDYAAANMQASGINYQVVQFTDNSVTPAKVYYILERTPESTSRYWGTYVFNPAPARSKLVIQCPHPKYDRNTGKQGFRVFYQAGARAYFVAGIHRCNGITFSSCDGTTTACSEESEAYRYSDQPHVVLGTFQITTEEMLAVIPDMIVVQPHGFSQDSGDPDIIMSNGTYFTPEIDYLLNLRDNLLTQDASLTFKVAHIDLEWTKLVARTNTQGRLINNSPDPCGTYATSVTGRFLHLEQTYSGLRDTEANWQKLVNAVIMTFPDDCGCYPGDANNSGAVNILDATYIINYLYRGGLPPSPYATCSGDANCNGGVNIMDATYLINYLYKNGPAPCSCLIWTADYGAPY